MNDADLDAALAERLHRFDRDMLVARTMRTEKAQEHWTAAAVKRAVADIKSLCRDGAPPVLEGDGQGGSKPELRLVE